MLYSEGGVVDILAAWELFISFMDRIVAWLYFVIGKGEWNPDYGK